MQQLANLQKQVSQLKTDSAHPVSRRAQEAEDYLYLGMAHLEQGIEEGFGKPETLKASCAALIESLKRNARDERPALVLSYLFMMIEDYETAQEYLSLAQEIHFENPMTQALKDSLNELIRAEAQAQQELSRIETIANPAGEAEPDYDALYDRLEQFIVTQVQELSLQAPPVPGLDTLHYQNLKQQLQLLQANKSEIDQRLAVLEAEFDLTELRTQMRPFEIVVHRFQETCELSKAFRALLRDMKADITEMESLQEALQSSSHEVDIMEMEQRLEGFLDRCDAFADQLDQWAEQRLEVSALTKTYEKLAQKLDKVQDSLDESGAN